MIPKLSAVALLVPFLLTQITFGDGPQDNSVDNVRQVPPMGIALSREQAVKLENRLKQISLMVEKANLEKSTFAQRYLPDVEVLHRAVSQALHHNEMYSEGDYKAALELLDLAEERIVALSNGAAPWTRQHGLVVRGFRSPLDGTVQPYGLEIAEDYDFNYPSPARCDIWFHGRGERSLELQFCNQRRKRNGPYPPTSGIVLHPYGRYSNAFKFAGEVDTLEALEHVKQNYNIDNDRVSVRGFSMGGAACWQFAVHTSDRWFAANPGAGFSETPEFLKSFQGETLNPPWWEERLWRMYDCNLWAENLQHLPTVAYSGEIDRQKQAADLMEAQLREHGIDLTHIIGPETAHSIHRESNQIIREKFDHLAKRGLQRFPSHVYLTTFTLKYNTMHWVTIEGIDEHWEKSSIGAEIENSSNLSVAASGVTDFSINFPPGTSPFRLRSTVKVKIGDQELKSTRTKTDLSFHAQFHKVGAEWRFGPRPADGLRKSHDLQGPIDDALMQPFLFVSPSGIDENPKVQAWVEAEMNRAVKEWRRHMRGDVRIKKDADVTDEDIASYNLICWGTPQSNSIIKKTSGDLPISWNTQRVQVGEQEYAIESHVPILTYPNPLNGNKYIVFNSSFTYREYDYLNNARQTPKLPDWAIIDVNTAPNSRWPGKIVDANFFDESWKLK